MPLRQYHQLAVTASRRRLRCAAAASHFIPPGERALSVRPANRGPAMAYCHRCGAKIITGVLERLEHMNQELARYPRGRVRRSGT